MANDKYTPLFQGDKRTRLEIKVDEAGQKLLDHVDLVHEFGIPGSADNAKALETLRDRRVQARMLCNRASRLARVVDALVLATCGPGADRQTYYAAADSVVSWYLSRTAIGEDAVCLDDVLEILGRDIIQPIIPTPDGPGWLLWYDDEGGSLRAGDHAIRDGRRYTVVSREHLFGTRVLYCGKPGSAPPRVPDDRVIPSYPEDQE